VNGNKRTFHNNTQSSGSGKNPYELRTELLNLAYQICYNQHVADEITTQLDRDTTTVPQSAYPRTAPSTAEVVECAEQLNEFISQKTNSPSGGDFYS